MKFPTASSVTNVGFLQFRIRVDLKTKAYCVPLTQQITDENFNSQFSTKAVAWAMCDVVRSFDSVVHCALSLISFRVLVPKCSVFYFKPIHSSTFDTTEHIFTFLNFFSDRLSTS